MLAFFAGFYLPYLNAWDFCTIFLQGDFLGSLETSPVGPETTLDNPRNVWGSANHSGLPIVILGSS